MGKKKSCQNVKVPRPLNAVEQGLYALVEEAIFTQPSMVLADSLPELRENMRLTEDIASKDDFVLEAELFTRLGVYLPFTELQKEVMARYRVAVSQLHLNGWGLMRTFERVCLHFGFWPTCRLFMYIYDILIPPSGYGFISFRAHQGRKLFGNLFPWVYWNREVKDFVVHNLDPLEMAACNSLLSLLAGLPKKNDFNCHWILYHSDAEVKKFLDSLLLVKMKQNKLDRLMAMLADPGKMAPRGILPTGVAPGYSSTADLAPTPAAPAGTSSQVPPPPSGGSKAKKGPSKREHPPVVNVDEEEGVREDPSADLRQKRRRKEGKSEAVVDRVLREDAAWEYLVNLLDLAFPKGYNFRKALDARLTSASVRKPLQTMPPEQLLGESWRLSCQSLVGLETALAAKTKVEEEFVAVQDQLSVKKGERQSALERVSRLEEDINVLQTELKSCCSSLEQEQKSAEVAEKKIEELSSSLHKNQFDLAAANVMSTYWCTMIISNIFIFGLILAFVGCVSLIWIRGLDLYGPAEENFLGHLSHPNLVKLLGYCWEQAKLLLIY
ncbi:hypothetical protein PIB30_040618 [Stylosanthes scabra]|uniref:Uncharacterized protein n=1 Tax=Stylosanthes scabra TaxID=79078 RepID=A0ABU6TEC2_9FABA|nr:hypothetical protein [Stylosanthes scabra]